MEGMGKMASHLDEFAFSLQISSMTSKNKMAMQVQDVLGDGEKQKCSHTEEKQCPSRKNKQQK